MRLESEVNGSDQQVSAWILPEPQINWRSFLASYGFVGFLALLLAFIGIILPDTLKVLPNYHVTELIPRPSLKPDPEVSHPNKPLPVHAKLLPAVPVVETPKLVVPREMRAAKAQPAPEVEAPKLAMNNLAPAVLKPLPEGRGRC